MNTPFQIFIGWRYIKNRKQTGSDNKFISFISMLSMVGITLGVAALIIVLSVMNGFQKEITDKILSATSHIEISSPNKVFENVDLIINTAKQNTHVVGVAPYVQGQVMATSQKPTMGDGGVSGAMIRGIDLTQEKSVSDFDKKITSGDINSLIKGDFKIAIGSDLAKKFSAKVGDRITIISPEGVVTPAGVIPRIKSFQIGAIFHLGMFEYDNGLILANIDDTKALLRLGDGVTGIRIKVDEPYKAREISYQISKTLKEDAYIDDWTLMHSNFFKALQIEKKMMFIILSLIIAVAAFNIVSTLVMAVTDKRSDIAILRTIGASSKSILAIFMFQGAVIGMLGVIMGVLFGSLVSYNIDVIVPFIEKLFHTQFLPGDVYNLTELPSDLQLSDVLNISISAILVTLLSTIYPSIKASKINPAEALRHE